MNEARKFSDRAAMMLLIALLVVAYADILLLGRGFFISDLNSYHYPMKHVVREAVRSGEFPYWNPLFSCGAPLAANPVYELFYPPQWLVYLLPFHFGVQLHIWLHFAIAAIGIFLLLRRLGASPAAAVFGSIAFVFCGSYLSLSSRLPLLFSISWLPLVLLLTLRFLENRSGPRLLALSSVMAMQFIIGEPSVVIQTWGLIAGWAVLRVFGSTSWKTESKRLAIGIGIAAVAAILLGSVQLLPAIDFARDTVRARSFDFRIVSSWSTPPIRLVELIFPGVLRHTAAANGDAVIKTIYAFRNDAYLIEIYAGAVVVLLALAGLFAGVRGRWIFSGTMTAALILAIGDHTPVLKALYDIGIFSSIRFPEKFLLTVAFAIAVWGALVFERLLAGDQRVARWAFGLAVAWLVLSILLLLNAPAGGALATRQYFAVNCLRAALATAWLWMMRRPTNAWAYIGIALLAVDLWFGTLNAVPRERREFFNPPPLLERVDRSQPYRLFNEVAWLVWEGDAGSNQVLRLAQGSDFEWVVRNSLTPEIPAERGLATALEQDIDQTSLKKMDDFVQAMIGTRSPHVPGADEPYARMANVGWRVLPRELNETLRQQIQNDARHAMPVAIAPSAVRVPRYSFAGRLERAPDAGGFRFAVERNAADPSVAYVDADPFPPAKGRVTAFHETANTATIDVAAEGRAYFVASITGHKYWSATIDGRPATLLETNLAFQGLVVPPGPHRIEMRYRNPLVAIGAAISLLTLVGLLFVERLRR
jgi:hypothetical protein